jgi:hypothetical protein
MVVVAFLLTSIIAHQRIVYPIQCGYWGKLLLIFDVLVFFDLECV